MTYQPPEPDASSNQFKRSIVSGRFVVQDRYEFYGATGAPSGNVIDSGNSYFYGDVSVSGVLTVLNSASLPNYYNTTQSNERYYTKEHIDGIPLGKTGDTGFTGSAGSPGAKGDTGFTGSAGSQGAKGDTGFTGAAGSPGAKGDTGFTGAAGSPGAKGDTGFTGSAGSPGAKGDTGFTGSAGSQGAMGDTGFTGAAGSPGAKGDTGFTGAAGSPGAKGDTGFTGAAGSPGAKGDTGFTGPEGIQGGRGIQGDVGPRGFTGPGGVQGPAGTNYFTQSGSDIYYNTGNVGIKKVPTSTLDVNGTLTTGILNIGNYLKTGGTATLLSSSVNLTFPIDSYYYVYENYISGWLDIRLPDVHNQNIPPFQFTIVNMYAYATYGLQPYSSNASTPTFLYSKTRQQLASRNQTYDVPTSTAISIFTTIHYYDKNWYIM
jgi:hypothetical protein